MSIASISAAYSPSATPATPGTGPMADMHQLGKALRSGDLDAAKQAYANILKNPPPGATWNPDSAFAKLGQALKSGDMEQAKSIAQAAVKELRSQGPRSQPAPDPMGNTGIVPDSDDAGTTVGGLLNVVA